MFVCTIWVHLRKKNVLYLLEHLVLYRSLQHLKEVWWKKCGSEKANISFILIFYIQTAIGEFKECVTLCYRNVYV